MGVALGERHAFSHGPSAPTRPHGHIKVARPALRFLGAGSVSLGARGNSVILRRKPSFLAPSVHLVLRKAFDFQVLAVEVGGQIWRNRMNE